MSQIHEISPKHCAKKGFHFKSIFNFLNKKLFKILFSLILSIISLILLIWFILHPSKPQFSLREIDINELNFSSPGLLNSSIEITFESQNPNQRVGIYYDDLRAHATYKNQQITLDTYIPQLYQKQQDSDLITVSLIGNNIPIAPSIRYEAARDQANGRLVLRVKIEGKIRWKVATWISGHYQINVNCVAILSIETLNNNPTSPLNSKLGSQCSTNI